MLQKNDKHKSLINASKNDKHKSLKLMLQKMINIKA